MIPEAFFLTLDPPLVGWKIMAGLKICDAEQPICLFAREAA